MTNDNHKRIATVKLQALAESGLVQLPTTDAFFVPVSAGELRYAVREGRYIYCSAMQTNKSSSGVYYLENTNGNDSTQQTEIYSNFGKCVYNPQATLNLTNQLAGSIYDNYALYSDGDQNVWYYNRATQQAVMILDKSTATYIYKNVEYQCADEVKFRNPGFFAAGQFILVGDDKFLVFDYTETGTSFSRAYDLEPLQDKVTNAECPYVKGGRIYFSANGSNETTQLQTGNGETIEILRTTGCYSVAYSDTEVTDLRRENVSPDLYTSDGKGIYWIGNPNYNDKIGYVGYTGDYFNSNYTPQFGDMFEYTKAEAGVDFAIDADCELIFKDGLQSDFEIKSNGQSLKMVNNLITRNDLDDDDYKKQILYVGVWSMIITKKYVVLYRHYDWQPEAQSEDSFVKSPVEPCLIVFQSLNTHDLKLNMPADTEFFLRRIQPHEFIITG
ncbi:MAG: hypothetical protein DU429_07820 [Candidatus Tokpelaia sp.]|nr:MAG: hypothetical protein DU430_08170 [Candidatus Tokpelaia sp.]KAA6205531.1 MAG: hypothetical protein DU429_07820 [Candidatus Tokpelaia sp.]